jgi:hypothetical protein
MSRQTDHGLIAFQSGNRFAHAQCSRTGLRLDAPAQLRNRHRAGNALDPMLSTETIAQSVGAQSGRWRVSIVDPAATWNQTMVSGAEQPTSALAPLQPVQEAAADERRVLRRLVGSEMREQSSISERDRVAIEHEHALASTRYREDLASATLTILVAAKRWTGIASDSTSPAGARGLATAFAGPSAIDTAGRRP